MNRTFLKLESLENRVLLDAGLGSEIADFASQEAVAANLLDRAVAQHQWMFNQPVNQWRCWDVCPEIAFDGPVLFSDMDANFGGAPTAETPTFSDTNTQVNGVDEGDIVETDGKYIYTLSNNMVTIVDVRELAHPRVTSRIRLDGDASASEIYLDGDRLTVISSGHNYGPIVDPPIFIDPPILIDPVIDVDPVLGFWGGIPWQPSQPTVEVRVYDVANREDPNLITTTEIDGSLANSRAIDGKAYLVVDEYLQFPQPSVAAKVDTIETEDGDLIEVQIYESEESYRARVADSILDVLPNYETVKFNGGVEAEGLVAEFDATYSTEDNNYNSALSVVSIDMQAEVPTAVDGNIVITNSSRELFMSQDSMYLFQNEWGDGPQTAILKFDVDTDAGEVTPVASGIVPGNLLDQFSADEYGGDLRIATTQGWGEEGSALYVLEEVDDNLVVKGSVEKLAPGERIFSARFMGERAYIVTFRQVDPLFAIDLSDPTEPVVKGELKIPGFSEYLQPMDENHLLAIGRDADPETGIAESLQLSLFDVSDMTDPQLVDRYTFEGERWNTWSPAEHDHHAFRYFPESQKMAIPVSSHGEGTWIRDEDGRRDWVPAPFTHALHVFSVDAEEGFDFDGAVAHPSEVMRSVRVGDKLYSISRDTFIANELNDLESQLGQIHFLPPANGGVIPKEPSLDDIDQIFAGAREEEYDRSLDLDGNALVSPDDATFLVEAVINSRRGDTNLDGNVDFRDFLQMAENFGQEGSWEDGDFNGDGIVDFADFIVLSQNFGE